MPEEGTGGHIPSSIYTTKHGGTRNFPFIGNVEGHPIIRYVGTEIEFHDFAVMPNEEQVQSLKNVVLSYGGGIELDAPWNAEVVLAPARGKKYEQQVTDVCEVLNKLKAETTKVSGLHIHVDARDLKPNQRGRVMTMYARFEPLILQTQPVARFGTKFCKPIGTSLLEGWEKIKRGDITGPEALYKAKATQLTPGGHDSRYKAVNFAAFYKHGTIEIRMHEGTTNAKEILGWAIFWVHFIEEAAHVPLKKAKDFDESLESLSKLVAPADKYIKARLGQYKDQWTPAKVKSMIPSGASTGISCPNCGSFVTKAYSPGYMKCIPCEWIFKI